VTGASATHAALRSEDRHGKVFRSTAEVSSNRPAAQARLSAASITETDRPLTPTTSRTDSRAYPCHSELADARMAARTRLRSTPLSKYDGGRAR
jgi:hypothetical protein